MVAAQKVVLIGCVGMGCKIFLAPTLINIATKLISGESFGGTTTLDKIVEIKVTEQASSEKERSIDKISSKTLVQALIELIIAKAESYKK